jgi:hypothetical protein
MRTIKVKVLSLIFMISWAGVASANSHTRPDRVKIFVLRDNAKSSLVLPSKEASKQTATFMRMPDLGENSSSRDSSGHQTSKHGSTGDGASAGAKVARHGGSKRQIAETQVEPQIGTAKRPMRFSGSKISGTLRLPRIKFARVGVQMENRDESPSLDFTPKSLRENGY